MTSCEEARQRAENRESNVDRSVWANKLLAGGFPRPDLPRNFLTFWGMSCVGVPSTSHHSLPRSVSAHICEDNYRKRYGESRQMSPFVSRTITRKMSNACRAGIIPVTR